MTDTPVDPFEQWLGTGTVSQRSVDIYARPDLFARYEHLAREYEVARQVEQAGERTLGDSSVSDLEQQLEDLYEEWQASKTIWYIRSLNPEEIDQIAEKAKYPEDLKEKAGPTETRHHQILMREANTRSNILTIATALVKIENAQGELIRESVTEDEMWKMRKQFGDQQVLKLVTAALVASSSDVAMPVPTSRSNSRNDRS